jgi:hypothetical protein
MASNAAIGSISGWASALRSHIGSTGQARGPRGGFTDAEVAAPEVVDAKTEGQGMRFEGAWIVCW